MNELLTRNDTSTVSQAPPAARAGRSSREGSTGAPHTPRAEPRTQPQADRPDLMQRLLQSSESRALSRLRGPIVMAAQRVGLTSRRCGQLEMGLAECRHRLVVGGMSSEDRRVTEQRVFDLERALHEERLFLWRDLLPLADTARDAAVDAMRASWLNELGRVLGGDGQ